MTILETAETPAEIIACLEGLSPSALTWEDIRAIAENEIRQADVCQLDDYPVDDADIREWNRRAETNRAWFERNL
jgi:hypothetical protein